MSDQNVCKCGAKEIYTEANHIEFACGTTMKRWRGQRSGKSCVRTEWNGSHECVRRQLKQVSEENIDLKDRCAGNYDTIGGSIPTSWAWNQACKTIQRLHDKDRDTGRQLAAEKQRYKVAAEMWDGVADERDGLARRLETAGLCWDHARGDIDSEEAIEVMDAALDGDLPEQSPCRGCEDRDKVIDEVGRHAFNSCALATPANISISAIRDILARHDEGKRT